MHSLGRFTAPDTLFWSQTEDVCSCTKEEQSCGVGVLFTFCSHFFERIMLVHAEMKYPRIQDTTVLQSSESIKMGTIKACCHWRREPKHRMASDNSTRRFGWVAVAHTLSPKFLFFFEISTCGLIQDFTIPSFPDAFAGDHLGVSKCWTSRFTRFTRHRV